MTIRQKTMLWTGAVLALSLAVLYVTGDALFVRHVNIAEVDYAQQQITTLRSLIQNSVEDIRQSIYDWAVWDETYDFFRDRDAAYIERNLTTDGVARLRLNLVLFIDSSGAVPYAELFHVSGQKRMPIPRDMQDELTTCARERLIDGMEKATSMFYLRSNEVYVVTSHEVLMSDRAGPSLGTVVFGRLFDSSEQEHLAAIIRQPFELAAIDRLPPCPEDEGTTCGDMISVIRAETVCTCLVLENLRGERVLTLRIVQPRTMYRIGRKAVRYFLAAVFSMGALLITVTLLVQRRLALDPLSRLSAEVSRIGAEPKPESRVGVPGVGSELDGLAETINLMLASLEKTQQDLKETSRRFRSLFESMTEAVVLHELVLDSQGKVIDYRFLDVNPAFEKHAGVPAASVRGKLATAVFGTTRAPMLDIFSAVAETGVSHSFENFYEPLGRYYHISAFSPARNQFATVFEDITEKRRAEEALREKSDELNRYFSFALDLLCIADVNGRFRRLNPAWESVLGYRVEELEGLRIIDLVHADEMDAAKAAMAELRKGRDIRGLINRCRHKDGSYRWIEWRASPYQQRLIYAIARDITERRAAEEALHASEEKFRAMVEHIDLGVILLTEDKRVVFVNQRMRQWYPSIELGDASACFHCKPYREGDACIECPVADVLQDGHHHERIMRFVIDGETKHFRIMASPITDDRGRRMVIELMEDITGRVEAERRLMDSMNELERFNRLMTGRELRMLELKKEINELLAQQGRPAKYKAAEDRDITK